MVEARARPAVVPVAPRVEAPLARAKDDPALAGIDTDRLLKSAARLVPPAAIVAAGAIGLGFVLLAAGARAAQRAFDRAEREEDAERWRDQGRGAIGG